MKIEGLQFSWFAVKFSQKHFQNTAVKIWLKIMKINKTCDYGDSKPKKFLEEPK